MSKRAGLQFSVSTADKLIREHVQPGTRVSRGAAVYFAALLEYISAEIADVSSKGVKGKLITASKMQTAINRDAELQSLM